MGYYCFNVCCREILPYDKLRHFCDAVLRETPSTQATLRGVTLRALGLGPRARGVHGRGGVDRTAILPQHTASIHLCDAALQGSPIGDPGLNYWADHLTELLGGGGLRFRLYYLRIIMLDITVEINTLRCG